MGWRGVRGGCCGVGVEGTVEMLLWGWWGGGGGRRGAVVERGEEGRGFALEAVAPVGEAEAEAEAGEDGREV